MKTIGELCDHHATLEKQSDVGSRAPFYVTVVEPLLQMIEEETGLKGNYKVPSRLAAIAVTTFIDGEKKSTPLRIDYQSGSVRTLRIWTDSESVPGSLTVNVDPESTYFVIPRDWTAKDFVQLIEF